MAGKGPQRVDLGRGGFSPAEVAKAYREEHPRLFDDLDDFELIEAIRAEDPDTYRLIDPLLEGAHVLAPPKQSAAAPRKLVTGETADPTKPYPLPTITPTANPLISTGLRVIPSVAGGLLGLAGGPAGVAAGGAAGAGLGETAAQYYEKRAGEREAMSAPTILFETGLGAFNPATKGATALGRAAWQTAFGATVGGVGAAGRPVIEEGRAPTAREVVTGAVTGGAFGGAVSGAFEGASKLTQAGRAATSFADDVTGALPPGPPAPPMLIDRAPLIQAADAQYQLEEQILAKRLTDVFGPDADTRPPGSPDLHTAMEAKAHLTRLAALSDRQKALSAQLQPPPAGIESLGTPYGPPPSSPLLLPERAGIGAQAPPDAILAYPPGVDPSGAVDVVGSPPPRVLAGRTPIEAAVEDALQMPPGPPRLGGRVLALRPPAAEAGVPRGTAELPIGTPPPTMDQPILQQPVVGGRKPTDQQPRLPKVLEGQPPDRVYATGPNAGPRRATELHNRPRKAIRYVDTPQGRVREVYDSPLPAEDPGTYPPEVRRELAAMAWELEQYPHERVQGGITQGQIRALEAEGLNTSDAIAELKRRGATAGGALPGAPVYHDIIEAAQGPYQHITRAEMLQNIRAALVEGRGSGVSDAAAQVARARAAERASGRKLSDRILARKGDEGDDLIGWVDDTGARTVPEADLDEFQRVVREAETGELLAAHRMRQEGGEVAEGTEAYFDAATEELVRRGVILPRQEGLTMEGPGGAGGPRLLDFDGGPPGKPTQPELPGTEGVRQTEIPTPQVADLPFALTPPPNKPARTQAAMTARRQRGLFESLKGEEGTIIFDVPAGDRAGFRKWLKSQEKDHGGEAWFNRAEQAAEAGDWDRAFKTAAAASVHSYARAYQQTQTRQQEAALERSVRGTPLQDTIETQIISGARQRAGVGTAPPVKEFPPSPRVTQAGAARGKATIGPAGILNPGPRQRPLSSAAPALRAATLDREVVKLLMEGIEHPEGLATVPGNTDTYLRLFRQVGEQVYRGQNLKLLREAGVSIPPEELAQHFNATVTDAARTLNLLSQFARTNATVLQEAAESMSMGGALRGMVGGAPPRYVGAGGREMSPGGQTAVQAVVDQIADETSRYHAAALANDMQKRRPIGPLRALHDASYSWMLSKWNTAVRNYMSFTGRYGVESLDHALTIPIARILGDEPTSTISRELLRARGLQPMGRTGTGVTPRRAWGETLQEIHNFTVDRLNELKPSDARRAIRLLLDLPEQGAHYLGTVGGEDLSAAFSDTPVIRHLVNPKVQRFLTQFNRAQEFSARATVFDASVRAQLRAQGLDPNVTLVKPTAGVIADVGGQAAFERLLFTATSQALEATFAGRTSRDSIPGALIRFVNDAWPLKLGVPFPRFNFSAAPRFLFDHSPAALLDWVRFPLDRAGITAPAGTAAGGRLYRGVRAQEILQTDLPQLQRQMREAEKAQGQALQDLLATQREWNVRQRQVTRLEKRAQPGLPETQTALETAAAARDQLARTRERLKGEIKAQSGVVKDLQSQQKKLLTRVEDATAINAPNFSQSLARMGVGTVGLLGAAWVVRAQEGAKGTRWYEYRVDRGEGKEPLILDFRPFAPFAQYLFVADVLNDFLQHTNWQDVHAEVATPEEGMVASPLDWSRAIWQHYEGKYTEQELGTQFAQAFFSISRAAGTTLTLTDMLTNMDVPSLEEATRALVGTIGQFFSRFTVPGQMYSDVAGQFDPEEAKVRTPPKATIEDWERPLAGPIANVPYARQLIPERISQTTGKPVAAEFPLLRGLAGIGAAPRDFITEEVRRVGVPGSTVFIRETGDYGLDRLTAETYSQLLQAELPSILEDPFYVELGTPARQRDFLQRNIFPSLKRAALGEVRESLGTEQYEAATVRGEVARRKARQQRLLESLIDDLGPAPPEDLVGAPPPPAP